MAEDDSDKGGTDVIEREAPERPSTVVPAAEPRQSLGELVGTPPGLAEARTGLQRQKIDIQERFFGQTEQQLDQDRARIQKAFDATGIEPGTMQPWDSDKMREKFRTDPLEAFGSLGSVFAMVASAFTRAPMENALNGAAAAMNAVKAGDQQEFERAYAAWKENNALALQRHNIMQQRYSDALQLMNTDMSAARAKMQMLATSFDDRQLLTFMEAGMDKEMLETIHKRDQIAKDQLEISERMDQSAFQRQAFKSILEQNKQIQDPAKRAVQNLMAFNRIYQGKIESPQQAILGQFMFEKPKATADEIADFASEKGLLPRSTRKNADQEFIARFYEQYPDATPEQFQEAFGKFKREQKPASAAAPNLQRIQAEEIKRRADVYMKSTEEGGEGLSPAEAFDKASKEVIAASTKPGGGGVVTDQRLQAQAIQKRATELQAPKEEGGKGLSASEAYVEAAREIKSQTATITGNRRDQLKGRADQFGHSLDKIDAVTGTLNKYIGTAGTAGYARRLEERLSNLVGSKRTDFVQMMRDIEYLREAGPRLLLDAGGRPLSAEANRINNIIGGLNAGDTTANTLRSMKELKKLYAQMKQEVETRLGSAPKDDATLPEGATPTTKSGEWWQKLPDKAKE